MKPSKTLTMMKRLWRLLLCGVLGFVGASLSQSLHSPSVEANTTRGATAADSGSGPPIINGVGWIRNHSTTFSSVLTGHCEYICPTLRCPRLTGIAIGSWVGLADDGGIRVSVRFMRRRGVPDTSVAMGLTLRDSVIGKHSLRPRPRKQHFKPLSS
jgi:hypothetical protein